MQWELSRWAARARGRSLEIHVSDLAQMRETCSSGAAMRRCEVWRGRNKTKLKAFNKKKKEASEETKEKESCCATNASRKITASCSTPQPQSTTGIPRPSTIKNPPHWMSQLRWRPAMKDQSMQHTLGLPTSIL